MVRIGIAEDDQTSIDQLHDMLLSAPKGINRFAFSRKKKPVWKMAGLREKPKEL